MGTKPEYIYPYQADKSEIEVLFLVNLAVVIHFLMPVTYFTTLYSLRPRSLPPSYYSKTGCQWFDSTFVTKVRK